MTQQTIIVNEPDADRVVKENNNFTDLYNGVALVSNTIGTLATAANLNSSVASLLDMVNARAILASTYTKDETEGRITIAISNYDVQNQSQHTLLSTSLSLKADQSSTFTKTEISTTVATLATISSLNSSVASILDLMNLRAEKTAVYSKSEIDNLFITYHDTSSMSSTASTTYVALAGSTMSGPLVLNANPTLALGAATKSYVDNFVISGTTWRPPIVSAILNDIVAAPPVSPTIGATYIAAMAGTWLGVPVNIGSIVEWSGNAWVVIKVLEVGDRFIIGNGIGAVLSSITINSHTLIKADLIQYLGGTLNSAASWSLPEGHAGLSPNMPQGTTVIVNSALSINIGHTYLFNAAGIGSWIEISGPGSVQAGTALSYIGNVINVNLGAGISQVPSNSVGINIYPGGGLMTTTDGNSSSTSIGSRLSLSKLGNAGTYTKVTTDAYGRITVGSNPTSLSGYGIILTTSDIAPLMGTIPATTISIAPVTNNATYYPTFVSTLTGSAQLDVNAGFTFNPSSNTLTTSVLAASSVTASTIITNTVNGNTISPSNGTLSLAAGSTLATSGANAITMSTTANSTVALPAGAHTMATLDVAQTFTAVQVMQPTTSSSSNYTWNCATDPNLTLTTTGNLTMNAPTNIIPGAFYQLLISYSGTHTISWNTIFKGMANLSVSSATGLVDSFTFRAAANSTLMLIGYRLNVNS